jgi:hypothetical protein
MRTSDANMAHTHRDDTRPAYTPDNVSSLKPDEVFVFGSNLAGMHEGGAARAACIRFGAIMGQGVGLQGQSYAIPTMQGGVETIRPYVDDFIRFAKEHKELFFYVTRIGCGIAGFKDEEIAPLFAAAIDLDNICLPRSFATILQNGSETRNVILTHAHGITRTFADIVIARNEIEKFKSANEVINYLLKYFERFIKSGDHVAFNAIRTFNHVIHQKEDNVFTPSGLDVERFRSKMFNFHEFSEHFEIAYTQYCIEKICNVVAFLNEFRRYDCAEKIWDDINKCGLTQFSHCGPNDREYLMLPMGASCYSPTSLVRTFYGFLSMHWGKIAPNGTLNANLLNEYMFKKNERTLEQYGFDFVIRNNYREACCPVFYEPIDFGTGPIYESKNNQQFIRTCNGVEPNYCLETKIAFNILRNDDNYELIDLYMVPKNDMTLPILHCNEGLVSFNSVEEKCKFIEKLKKKN